MTDTDVKRLIRSRQAFLGYSNEYMAVKMHMSLSSWNRRMREPSEIKVKDLLKLEKVLNTELIRRA